MSKICKKCTKEFNGEVCPECGSPADGTPEASPPMKQVDTKEDLSTSATPEAVSNQSFEDSSQEPSKQNISESESLSEEASFSTPIPPTEQGYTPINNKRKLPIRLIIEIAGGILLLCLIITVSQRISKSTYMNLKSSYNTVSSDLESLKKSNADLQTDLDKEKSDKESLNKEYVAYKERMKPYEDMESAEAEARKIAAEQEKAAAAQAEADKKAAEEAAAAQAAEEAAAAQAAQEAQGFETGITFDDLSRNPDEHMAKKVKFSGKVIQVVEGTSEIQIRLATNGKYGDVIYCAYKKDLVSSRVLEDDKITIYGTSAGLLSYKSTMGSTITLPSVQVERIDQ